MQKKRNIVFVAMGVLVVYLFLINQKPPENPIQVQQKPPASYLHGLGVYTWQTWSKETSEFIWQFSEKEVAYILEGEVLVTHEGSDQAILIKKGDLVTFAPGLRCRWQVLQPIKKHVTLEQNLLGKLFWKATFKVQELHRFIDSQTQLLAQSYTNQNA
jgi:uncharacterized cupin superfamily protein